jgi:hypothetical protein
MSSYHCHNSLHLPLTTSPLLTPTLSWTDPLGPGGGAARRPGGWRRTRAAGGPWGRRAYPLPPLQGRVAVMERHPTARLLPLSILIIFVIFYHHFITSYPSFVTQAYISPSAVFTDGGRSWLCPFCATSNPVRYPPSIILPVLPQSCPSLWYPHPPSFPHLQVPDVYFCNLDHMGKRHDVRERPELLRGTVEYSAPAAYCARPPQVEWAVEEWGGGGSVCVTLGVLVPGCHGFLSQTHAIGVGQSSIYCVFNPYFPTCLPRVSPCSGHPFHRPRSFHP